MKKSSLSQNFFAMSQNLHIIFLNFLNKIECLGQIFQLWDTAKKFWDKSCFGTKISDPRKKIFFKLKVAKENVHKFHGYKILKNNLELLKYLILS